MTIFQTKAGTDHQLVDWSKRVEDSNQRWLMRASTSADTGPKGFAESVSCIGATNLEFVRHTSMCPTIVIR